MGGGLVIVLLEGGVYNKVYYGLKKNKKNYSILFKKKIVFFAEIIKIIF